VTSQRVWLLDGVLPALFLLAASAASALALEALFRKQKSDQPIMRRLVLVSAMLIGLHWILLLWRDPTWAKWVTFLDTFVILGIAWIPSFFVLQIPREGLRTALYPLVSALALAWIVVHTLAHAIAASAVSGTASVTVAACCAGFAVLNVMLIDSRRKRADQPAGHSLSTNQARLASVISVSALIVAITSVVLGMMSGPK
jgi:hypothetical protein